MDETMAASRSASDPLAAVVKRRRGISIVWAVPIVATLIGGYLAYRAYSETGPTITLSFATAEGLEAGKTKVRYLDVEVGTVQTVAIAPDLKHIIVTAGMTPGAESYLREQTRFWIVKPRIGVGGVSGLGTLLSGAYIGLAPGEGAATRSFTGLEQPPPISANVAGREYTLTAATLGSVSQGAPIFYRGIDIGQVLDHELLPDQRGLDIKVFVRAPYSDLVRTTSRFWNASGISVSTGASGIDVQVGSLQSLIVGGIEFDTPPGTGASEVADAGASFPLYPNKAALAQAQFTQKIPFLVEFDGSVRGLSPGAPVEFRGIKVGVVTSVDLAFDPATAKIRIPVGIEIEPQRLVPGGFKQEELAANDYRRMAELVRRGLRAQLQTGNLLTGELFVDLTLVANAAPAELDTSGPVPVIPSVPATIEALQASVTAIMNKVAALPIEQLVGSLTKTATGLEAIVNTPDIHEAANSLGETMAQVRQLVGRIDAGADPLLGSVTTAAVSADATLRQAQATMASVQRTVGAGSALTDKAENVMQELARAARSIRVFADYLDRHPEALLRGRAGGGGP
jgi:paraquat-inducible protein B